MISENADNKTNSPGDTRMRTLRTRSVTAVVFGALMLLAIYTGKPGILIVLLCVQVLASHEFILMFRPGISRERLAFFMFILLLPYISLVQGLSILITVFATVQMPVVLWLLFFRKDLASLKTSDSLLALTGVLVVTIPALTGCYLALHLSDVTLRFLYIILTLWCFDIFAYLGGSFFGKHPLARRISPKKTLEGTAIGIVFTSIFALLLYKTLGLVGAVESFVLAGIVIFMGQSGDLLQSLHKRTAGVKDSGRLMPGHGGLWDRFDSLLGVLPALYLYYTFVLQAF